MKVKNIWLRVIDSNVISQGTKSHIARSKRGEFLLIQRT